MTAKQVRMLVIIVGLPLLTFALLSSVVEKVPLDRVGVKISLLGGQGATQHDYAPGFVFVAPFQHKLELVDPTYQILTWSPGHSPANPPFQLRLNDGFQTIIDVSVIYRLQPGKAHLAILRHGPGDNYKKKVKVIAEKYVWDVMTELVTEDFFNTPKRLAQAEKARDRMNTELQTEFVEVVDVLIRDIKYDEGFEELLRRKQKLDQERLLFASRKKLEDERKVTELIDRDTANQTMLIAENQAKEIRELVTTTESEISKIDADTGAAAQRLLADASSMARALKAEGELARTSARAEGERAVNEAYAQPGGSLYLARQTVENLTFGEVEINTSQTNPFDVGQLLRMLGVEADPAETTTTP